MSDFWNQVVGQMLLFSVITFAIVGTICAVVGTVMLMRIWGRAEVIAANLTFLVDVQADTYRLLKEK